MPEPNRWNYLEFEQPSAGPPRPPARGSDRSWFLELDGEQQRVYTGVFFKSRLLRNHLPERVARRFQAIPIELEDGVLKVAMAEPDNHQLLRELEREVERPVRAVRATPARIQQGLAEYRQDEPRPPLSPVFPAGRSYYSPPGMSMWERRDHRSPGHGYRAASLVTYIRIALVFMVMCMVLGYFALQFSR